MNQQKQHRSDKRRARKALSEAEKAAKSTAISEKLLQTDAYRQAKRIGAYLCLPEEVNVKSIIETAWADGKSVYLPVVLDWGQTLKFAPYTPDSRLIRDRLDIEIPAVCATEYLEASALDMVVTPLVAFDEQRNRIGMGGGFYDRTFAFKAEAKPFSKPQLIGVAFETQRLPVTITANPWDICPDAIISEKRIYTAE